MKGSRSGSRAFKNTFVRSAAIEVRRWEGGKVGRWDGGKVGRWLRQGGKV